MEGIIFVLLSWAGQLKWLLEDHQLLCFVQAHLGMIQCLLGDLQPPPDAPTELEVELCWFVFPHSPLEVLPSFDVVHVTTVFLHIYAIEHNSLM